MLLSNYHCIPLKNWPSQLLHFLLLCHIVGHYNKGKLWSKIWFTKPVGWPSILRFDLMRWFSCSNSGHMKFWLTCICIALTNWPSQQLSYWQQCHIVGHYYKGKYSTEYDSQCQWVNLRWYALISWGDLLALILATRRPLVRCGGEEGDGVQCPIETQP